MLTFSSTFTREKIKLITEIEPAADTAVNLMSGIYGVKSNLYVSEHKNSRDYDDKKRICQQL